LLTSHRVRRSVRSWQALALGLLLAATALVTVDAIVAPVEAIEARREAGLPIERGSPEIAAHVAQSPHLLGLVTWVTFGDDAQLEYLLERRPAVLSGIWVLLMLFTPFLVALSAFDQMAGDIGSRWMRFVLFRTHRGSVFAGRLLAATASSVGLFALLSLAVVAYLDLRLGVYGRAALYGWGFQGSLAVAALALPYVALCGLVSAASRSPGRALGGCVLATGLPIVVLGLTAARFESAAWVRWLHPWGWKLLLLHPECPTRLWAFGAMAAFTAAFALAGGAVFARRDL
jgi:hypothetical protein